MLAKLQGKEDDVKKAIQKAKRDIVEAKERHSNFVDNLGQNWDAATMDAVKAKIQKSAVEVEKLTGVLNQHQNKLKTLENMHSTGVPEQNTSSYDNPEKRRLVERIVETIVVDGEKIIIRLRT